MTERKTPDPERSSSFWAGDDGERHDRCCRGTKHYNGVSSAGRGSSTVTIARTVKHALVPRFKVSDRLRVSNRIQFDQW